MKIIASGQRNKKGAKLSAALETPERQAHEVSYQASHLCKAACDESRPAVVAKAQTVADTACYGQHVLESTPHLNTCPQNMHARCAEPHETAGSEAAQCASPYYWK